MKEEESYRNADLTPCPYQDKVTWVCSWEGCDKPKGVCPSLVVFEHRPYKEGGSSIRCLIGRTRTNDGPYTDCPACVYKHLTAAYALLTLGSGIAWNHDEVGVLIARALIALDEYTAGYRGNVDLAVGCLAAAECYCKNVHVRAVLRKARLALPKRVAWVRKEIETIAEQSLSTVATAHLVEAQRELPVNACYELCPPVVLDDPERLKECILKSIAWVVDTYELRQGEEGRNENK